MIDLAYLIIIYIFANDEKIRETIHRGAKSEEGEETGPL